MSNSSSNYAIPYDDANVEWKDAFAGNKVSGFSYSARLPALRSRPYITLLEVSSMYVCAHSPEHMDIDEAIWYGMTHSRKTQGFRPSNFRHGRSKNAVELGPNLCAWLIGAKL